MIDRNFFFFVIPKQKYINIYKIEVPFLRVFRKVRHTSLSPLLSFSIRYPGALKTNRKVAKSTNANQPQKKIEVKFTSMERVTLTR